MTAAAQPLPPIPAPGTMAEVAPGIHWVRMPLPFALDHVNLWLLEDGDGWTLVDTGLGNDPTRALWHEILEGPAAGRPVRRIVATHFHPDHLGLSGWLVERTGAEFLMTRAEWLTGRMLSGAGEEAGEAQAAFFRGHGLPAGPADALARRGNVYRRRAPSVPATYRRIAGGEVIAIGERRWQVVIGEGHSPEQACLYSQDGRILISGDQILPRITPNVGVQWFEPEANPLADFLGSVRRFGQMPEDTLVLPSHGRPFAELPRRLAALERHHAARLTDLTDACGKGRTAYELLDVLFRRKLDDHQLVFAMGEAIAHLAYLEKDGLLRRERDAGEAWRYRT